MALHDEIVTILRQILDGHEFVCDHDLKLGLSPDASSTDLESMTLPMMIQHCLAPIKTLDLNLALLMHFLDHQEKYDEKEIEIAVKYIVDVLKEMLVRLPKPITVLSVIPKLE